MSNEIQFKQYSWQLCFYMTYLVHLLELEHLLKGIPPRSAACIR